MQIPFSPANACEVAIWESDLIHPRLTPQRLPTRLAGKASRRSDRSILPQTPSAENRRLWAEVKPGPSSNRPSSNRRPADPTKNSTFKPSSNQRVKTQTYRLLLKNRPMRRAPLFHPRWRAASIGAGDGSQGLFLVPLNRTNNLTPLRPQLTAIRSLHSR